jgi:tRNA threonylcarbamoyladenosine biosynthesis protein TsaB
MAPNVCAKRLKAWERENMRILAIETTERFGTVALNEDDKLFLCKHLEPSQRSAQSLAPAIESILSEQGWEPNSVDLVGVTLGPGSFTGLRVGLATAKMFAYCVGADILGINTLDIIAARCPKEIDQVNVAIDAQRRELVACRYSRNSDGRMVADSPVQLIGVDIWLESLPQGAVISGPVLDKFSAQIPESTQLVPKEYRTPDASTLAHLAWLDYTAGRRDDLWQLVPLYSRLSAAEEKWNQNNPK